MHLTDLSLHLPGATRVWGKENEKTAIAATKEYLPAGAVTMQTLRSGQNVIQTLVDQGFYRSLLCNLHQVVLDLSPAISSSIREIMVESTSEWFQGFFNVLVDTYNPLIAQRKVPNFLAKDMDPF